MAISKDTFLSFSGLQTVSQSEKCLFCHSEFISESHNFNMLQTTEILKRVQDDNCDTVSEAGIQENQRKTGFPLKDCGNDMFLSFPFIFLSFPDLEAV
jgi:hypothetical protein